jgi:hypothetical protein
MLMRLSVLRHERVEIGKRLDVVGGAICNAGDDHAAIGVAREHNVAQALVVKHAEHVRHVRREIDRAAHQMRALALPGQRRREHRMAARAQQRSDLGVAPAAAPRAMHQNEGRHREQSD